MSILSALKETSHQSNNILDLAKLPQALIMQMAQSGEIPKDMVMPILGKKAEMVENAAKMKAAQAIAAQGGAQPTVMEKYMGEIAAADHPAPVAPPAPQQQMQQPQQPMPQQMAQSPMPQGPEDVGIASQATQPMGLAGGGIIAFDDGGDVDEEEDRYDEYKRKAKTNANFAIIGHMINNLKDMPVSSGSEIGIASGHHGAEHGMVNDADQARKHNLGNLRPSGFSYEGQVGTSKGGFAMFDSPEAGLKALHHDIGIKLNRGLDTPTKFISVYAPAGDKNDVGAYSKNVASMLGIGPNDKIPNTPEAKQLLAQAIIRQEGAHKATAAFAQGGIAHFDIGGDIDTAGAELDALRSGSDTLYQELMRGGSRGGNKSPELQAAYENALALRKQKEAQYEALMAQAGVNKPSFFLQSSLSTKRPEANPMVKRESVGAPPVVKPAAAGPANVAVENTTLPPQTKIPQNEAGIVNIKNEKANQDFDVMGYIKAREAKMEEAAKQDKWQAALAAGLGMLGGTSQYASENIGKGALMGVQQLAASQKLRAAQDKAAGELYGTGAQLDLMQRTRNDALKEKIREHDEKQNLASNDKLNKAIADAKKAPQNVQQANMLNILESQFANGKLDPSKLPELERLRRWDQEIENNVRKNFASGSGLKLVGVRG